MSDLISDNSRNNFFRKYIEKKYHITCDSNDYLLIDEKKMLGLFKYTPPSDIILSENA